MKILPSISFLLTTAAPEGEREERTDIAGHAYDARRAEVHEVVLAHRLFGGTESLARQPFANDNDIAARLKLLLAEQASCHQGNVIHAPVIQIDPANRAAHPLRERRTAIQDIVRTQVGDRLRSRKPVENVVRRAVGHAGVAVAMVHIQGLAP